MPKNLDENRPLFISGHGMNQVAGYQNGQLKAAERGHDAVYDLGSRVAMPPPCALVSMFGVDVK